MRWTLIVMLVIVCAAIANGEEVLLNGGDGINGKIVKVDENGIVLESDGKTLTLPPENLDALNYYHKWEKHVENTAKARLRLGVFAFENGLFSQARSQYRKAQKLDKEVVKDFEEKVVPKIREGVATRLLGLARQAAKDGKLHQAERIAAKILTQLEDTKAAEEARRVIASVHFSQKITERERLLKRLSKYLPKDEQAAVRERERLSKRLAPVERKIDHARDVVVKGLRTKSSNRQKKTFQHAARDFESVLKSLDTIEKASQDEPAILDQIGELRTIAKREAIEAYVHAGNVYMVRSSFNDAVDMANKALLLDPNSEHAKQFQKRVLVASTQNNGFWGRGRGRR